MFFEICPRIIYYLFLQTRYTMYIYRVRFVALKYSNRDTHYLPRLLSRTVRELIRYADGKPITFFLLSFHLLFTFQWMTNLFFHNPQASPIVPHKYIGNQIPNITVPSYIICSIASIFSMFAALQTFKMKIYTMHTHKIVL